MTQENIFKSFIEDPVFLEIKHFPKEQIDKIKFFEPTNDKLIEVIKLAISGNVDGDSESTISRRINQFLNK